MSKLVVLELGQNNYYQNLPVTLLQEKDGKLEKTGIEGFFPSKEELLKVQLSWTEGYDKAYRAYFDLRRRATKVSGQTTGYANKLLIDFQNQVKEFENCLNDWFNSKQLGSFKQELERKLNELTSVKVGEVRVLVKTDDPKLWRFPWHRLFPSREVGLMYPKFKELKRPIIPRQKVRILAVLGDSMGIDTHQDLTLLQKFLPDAEIVALGMKEFLTRQDLYDKLWDNIGWDILYFGGHSISLDGDKIGRIAINEKGESLNISQLKRAIRGAIWLGLKLAIFNSCYGVGLAWELASLYIPYVIVMRQSVPDDVAHGFLEHFLKAYSGGESLYNSVWQARTELESTLERKGYPCASWLPVICQNLSDVPPTWNDFGRKGETDWGATCRGMMTLEIIKKLRNNPLTRIVED
ncbi:MAG: CHAT domain-containing protein [Xenococcaceae cyanobacterium]